MKLSAKLWMYIYWSAQYFAVTLDEITFYTESVIIYYAIYAIAVFINTFIVLAWFLADSKESNYYPKRYFKILVLLFSYIVIPYYLIKVKGWRRAGVAFSKFFVYSLLIVIYFSILDYTEIFRNTLQTI